MTSDELLEMARLAGCGWAENGTEPMLLGEKQLERFASLVAAHEREECAKVCEQRRGMRERYCAEAIRARGES